MNDIGKCFCTEYLEKENMSKLSFINEAYTIYGSLNKGEKIILKYFGKLLTDDSSKETKIFLNYGYGNLWSDKNVLEMKLCYHSDRRCYCVQLELINTENLFFCFMDNYNNWDLNESSSYIIVIDTPITVLTKKTFSVALQEEDYMSTKSKFFKKLTDKLIIFFTKIGGIFDKKIKV